MICSSKLRKKKIYSEKEVRTFTKNTAKLRTQHELNMSSSEDTTDENKTGAINSAKDESANSDSGDISIRHPALSEHRPPPYTPASQNVGGLTTRVGPLIKNKLAHQ